MKNNEKFNIKKKLFYTLTTYIVSVLFVLTVSIFFQPIKVNGPSMLPTYEEGEIVFVNTIAKKLKHDDIIILYYGDIKLIKRVVGVPGNEILVTKSSLYVNNILVCNSNNDFVVEQNFILSNDEYFVLGDNYEDSVDSRYFGSVRMKNIFGKVYT